MQSTVVALATNSHLFYAHNYPNIPGLCIYRSRVANATFTGWSFHRRGKELVQSLGKDHETMMRVKSPPTPSLPYACRHS